MVSTIGFGASPLGNVFGEVDPEEGLRAVHFAIDHGINFFDTSPYYGLTLSEQRLGAALKGRRNNVVLATKCGRYGIDSFDFSKAAITRGLDASLRRLQTDHVDLLQVHDCEFTTVEQVVNETLPALEACRAAGKTRWIGITGYGLANLREIATKALSNGIQLDCMLSYCRQNLANSDMEQMLSPFAAEEEIGLINASPLHMGLLTEIGSPAWHPSGPKARTAALRAAALCRNYGTHIEELALVYAISSSPSLTLVGMGDAKDVMRNLSELNKPLPADQVKEVRALLLKGGAAEVWPSGLLENWDPGLKHEEDTRESKTYESIRS
jgi:L-galactose dehydrogenase